MKIEISTNAAIAILSFLREYIKDDEVYAPELTHLKSCINEYEKEVVSKITLDELESVFEDLQIQALIGNSPPLRGY